MCIRDGWQNLFSLWLWCRADIRNWPWLYSVSFNEEIKPGLRDILFFVSWIEMDLERERIDELAPKSNGNRNADFIFKSDNYDSTDEGK